MKKYRRWFLVVLLLFVTWPADAAEYSAQIDEFRRFAALQMQEDQIPGMTIGFARWEPGEETTWVEGFGYSDFENKVPAKEESAYRLGSVSKPMTALAVLLLAERGKMDLDAEIQTYVPYFPKKKWPVTVRELLGHLGGISHYKDYSTEGSIKVHKNTREAIAIFQDWDLIAEPGTKYSYSSYGYNLLAAAVEGASEMPFGEFMQQNIWGPMGMLNTRMDDPTDLISNRARGYRLLGGQIKNSEFVDISSRPGAGAFRSTVPDLLKFGKGVMKSAIVSAKTLPLIYSSMTTRDGEPIDYSTGWGVRPVNGHFILSHTGSQQETATALFCFPELKLVIACAVNQEDAGASVFVRRLFEILSGERWGLTACVRGKNNQYRALESVFEYGLSHFELYGKAASTDSTEIRRAVEAFQHAIAGSREAPAIKGREAKIVGSYMAEKIKNEFGLSVFERYHTLGAIPFFADYLKTCRAKSAGENLCSTPGSFRKLISQWNRSWARTSTDEIRSLRFNFQTDLNETGAQVRKVFHSEPAYPDYSRDIGDLTWESLLKGENEKSLQAGALGTELYPESARMLAIAGIALAAVSDKSRGVAALKKAFEMDPNSPAESLWLLDFAHELADVKKTTEAINVIAAGLELHPKEPQLLEFLGELKKKN